MPAACDQTLVSRVWLISSPSGLGGVRLSWTGSLEQTRGDPQIGGAESDGCEKLARVGPREIAQDTRDPPAKLHPADREQE